MQMDLVWQPLMTSEMLLEKMTLMSPKNKQSG